MTHDQGSRVVRVAVIVATMVLGGCASQAYDPTPPANRPVETLVFTTPLGLERSYRRVHERLEACVGGAHRVQPRYEHAPERAWVMVVSGLGLDRYSFLGNSFEARFDLEPVADGTRVSVSWVGNEMGTLAHAAEGWLVQGASGCSP